MEWTAEKSRELQLLLFLNSKYICIFILFPFSEQESLDRAALFFYQSFHLTFCRSVNYYTFPCLHPFFFVPPICFLAYQLHFCVSTLFWFNFSQNLTSFFVYFWQNHIFTSIFVDIFFLNGIFKITFGVLYRFLLSVFCGIYF